MWQLPTTDIHDVCREYGANQGEQINGSQIFRNWFMKPTAEESVELGYGRPFEPLAEEIGMLLRGYPEMSPERRKELEAALADPRWTKEWPECRQEVEESASDGDGEPVCDDDFLI